MGSSAGFVQPGTPTNSFTSKNEPGEGRAKQHLNYIFRSTAQRGRFLCAAALVPAWPMALGPAQAAAPSSCVLEASSSGVLTGELTTWEDNSDTPRARVQVRLESLEQEGPWWGQGIQQHQHPSMGLGRELADVRVLVCVGSKGIAPCQGLPARPP